MTREEWLEKNGFSGNGLTWCIFGEDTYSIKSYLKEQGCKFSPLLKWHSPQLLDLPEGYGMFSISYSDFMDWDEQEQAMVYHEDAETLVKSRFDEHEPTIESEYFFSEPGTRVRDMTVILKSHKTYNSRYGVQNIFTFVRGQWVFVWFTQTNLLIPRGSAINLTFTVKGYDLYHGVKTTLVSRCVTTSIEP